MKDSYSSKNNIIAKTPIEGMTSLGSGIPIWSGRELPNKVVLLHDSINLGYTLPINKAMYVQGTGKI